MNSKQREELAKYCFDISKLILVSLVFGFLQSKVDPKVLFISILTGLLSAGFFFIIGLLLFEHNN